MPQTFQEAWDELVMKCQYDTGGMNISELQKSVIVWADAWVRAAQHGAQRTDATQIIEDLLKLIYAYQDMHNRLGIGGEQSPSVLRAKEWLDANR